MMAPTMALLDSSDNVPPGMLKPVPRFSALTTEIPGSAGRCVYVRVHETASNLGRLMQLGQQRCQIDALSLTLNSDTLTDVVSVSILEPEICRAFSVYFTTLEQAYHWPKDVAVTTPIALQHHKLVVQVLHQPELRELLKKLMSETLPGRRQEFTAEEVARSALAMAQLMIEEARIAHRDRVSLDQEKQDKINLLYRTSRGDWFDQGDYRDPYSHIEFGGLHETIRTNGGQRAVQEKFELASGVSWLQKMPMLLENPTDNSDVLCSAFLDLQIAIALAREELYSMTIDEVVWGRTFAKFSKAVGFCSISAGGADCPMFRMLDALCGMAEGARQAVLLDELDFRSRAFPLNMRTLINDIAAAPSIRAYLTSGKASLKLTYAFRGLQQLLFSIYEMHQKKAMRIVLSLKAGQSSTSSGTEKADSHERHIANALKVAMKVRFGDNFEDLKIDAHAWSRPLIWSADGQVQAALVCFVFVTPLVVCPGDTISVTIQIKPGEQYTRTYSINQTYARIKSSKNNICQAVGSVEICVRSKGVVSSFLCQQHVGFPVRLAVKQACHFRINGNCGAKEETVFVAQGSAVGIFVSWLSRQENLTGKYLLVIGARNHALLPYADQLEKLAHTLGSRLQIVIAFSQAHPGDVRKLLQKRIKAYSGRVTEHLAQCSLGNIKATYMCGSAEFSLSVARCINLRHETRPSAMTCARLQPITTSRMPNMHLHVSAGLTSSNALGAVLLRTISLAELALHNSPGDIWIALGDRVYDISIVASFHPGGEKVLISRSGRRADILFNTVHNKSYEVESLLGQMIIGQVGSSSDELQRWDATLDKLVEIQNDLTNHTRFQEVPTGSRDQLNQAPPADVIRGSLECFVKSWVTLPAEAAIFTAVHDRLRFALQKTNAYFDEFQARVYKENFRDVPCCARALREIFDTYKKAAVKIHAVIDGLKWHIFVRASGGSLPDPSVFSEATSELVRIIENMSSINQE